MASQTPRTARLELLVLLDFISDNPYLSTVMLCGIRRTNNRMALWPMIARRQTPVALTNTQAEIGGSSLCWLGQLVLLISVYYP